MGYHVDAEEFFDRNTALGWVYGKFRTPVSDWKAHLSMAERWWLRDNQPSAEPTKDPSPTCGREPTKFVRDPGPDSPQWVLETCRKMDERETLDTGELERFVSWREGKDV